MRSKIFFILNFIVVWFCFECIQAQQYRTINIGSKKFTESVILGELAALLGQSKSSEVVHIKELGGTRVLWNALIRGEVDLYPEYTGTIIQEILSDKTIGRWDQLAQILSEYNIN
jgi:osmoprotectant transport system permease protein